MKLSLITAYSRSSPTTVTLISGYSYANKTATYRVKFPSSFRLSSGNKISNSFSLTICSFKSSSNVDSTGTETEAYNQSIDGEISSLNVEVGSPRILPTLFIPKFSLSDQAFFLLAFIACTTSVAFTSLVVAAVPTLFAMRRAAISLSKLADTAREELPSTMAAIRLSGMEISDLTLELSDLSQEIADGVNKSARAVQAAEAGIKQIGSLAHQQTMSMIQERADLPAISLQPVVAGAAKKTSRAVSQATRRFINMISGGELGSEMEDNGEVDAES
ncbi:uncharacterized protein LOC107802571 [Nicotiana tabacum]|uniref:Uncharacterized protein LOC107802571 n=1 Tax=Nicotiana tabacum TaxID=4097 RepID=A0A1S4AYJ8_TOBAC|nr:uncharacterized protein LOC104093828 [Nicotiana tomentosiformis]XP_016481573.1 PREDICTED: uncharacterized protein LOC107802571 [Nicotiana tabacum]